MHAQDTIEEIIKQDQYPFILSNYFQPVQISMCSTISISFAQLSLSLTGDY